MWPLSESGPYYAALVTGGTLDTKGGPKATPDGQVVDDLDRPIPGLYGVGNCVACHAGNLFTNQAFRYIGVRPQDEDLGRFLFTGQIGDRGRMKVPSLRNVELRAPYFHNGEMATLEEQRLALRRFLVARTGSESDADDYVLGLAKRGIIKLPGYEPPPALRGYEPSPGVDLVSHR